MEKYKECSVKELIEMLTAKVAHGELENGDKIKYIIITNDKPNNGKSNNGENFQPNKKQSRYIDINVIEKMTTSTTTANAPFRHIECEIKPLNIREDEEENKHKKMTYI